MLISKRESPTKDFLSGLQSFKNEIFLPFSEPTIKLLQVSQLPVFLCRNRTRRKLCGKYVLRRSLSKPPM